MFANPWVLGIIAVLELVFGFILLGFPYLLGASAIWVTGCVLIIAGVLRLCQLFRAGNRWWNLLAALVYLLLGWSMMAYTEASLIFWTYVIAFALMIGGVFRFVIACMMTEKKGKAWRFINAIVSVVLGVLIAYGWPGSSIWFIGTLIAVEMIFSGWTLLFMAIAQRPADGRA